MRSEKTRPLAAANQSRLLPARQGLLNGLSFRVFVEEPRMRSIWAFLEAQEYSQSSLFPANKQVDTLFTAPSRFPDHPDSSMR